MEMERALSIAVDGDDGVAAVLPPLIPSGQHRRHQLQEDEDDQEAELSDQECGGEDEDEDEDEDELDDAARYLPDRRQQQPDYDHHRPTTHGRRLIDEQIHRSMEVGVLMIQSLEFDDFYTALARVLEETNGGGFGGGGPASAAAVAALEKQAFHANAIEECGGAGGVTECAICLMEFDDGEEVSVMPCSRGHQFHSDCIAKWLGQSNSCPLCRRALPTATAVEGQ